MKTITTILSILIMTLAMAGVACSEPAKTFGWDANTEVDLAGYRVYQSDESGVYVFGTESPNFVAEIPCGMGDETCCEYLKVASPGPGHWYVGTAFDLYGNESLPSNEIESLPPGQLMHFRFK
ncbi:MAG: hypothetical protein JRI42_07705 [Deltaproteobacteria bacterium]|nr:hypothetical protein [Deltaproteobacteria bacterium]